jgi:prepilin-type N-terminal cleavage/methylation domain-containing protein
MAMTERTVNGRRGFTLIEVLVVAAILGIVVAALGACLAAGFRVWEEARRFGKGEQDVLLAVALIERDVANAFPFYAIPFAGSAEQVSFAGLVEAAVAESGADTTNVRRIASIRYTRSADRSVLLRKVWTYPAPEPADEAAEGLVAGVGSVAWGYRRHGADPWLTSWTDPTNVPAEVSLTIELAADGYRVERTFVRPVTNRPGGG